MAYSSNCLLTAGYSLPCKGIAGIQEVYIGNWNSTSLTYTVSAATASLNQITAFTGTTQSFYKFQQPIETAGFTNNGNFSDQNGTAYFDQVLEITITPVDYNTTNIVNTLSVGKWRVIILDQNGNYFLMGKTNPVTVSGLAGGVGKAYGDVNGYTITFTGKEPAVLTSISSAAALSVISLV